MTMSLSKKKKKKKTDSSSKFQQIICFFNVPKIHLKDWNWNIFENKNGTQVSEKTTRYLILPFDFRGGKLKWNQKEIREIREQFCSSVVMDPS